MRQTDPIRAAILRSTPCHDGGYLTVVRIEKPRREVAVRTPHELPAGGWVRIVPDAGYWKVAA